MADSDSEANIPDGATAQKLVKEFEGITNTDEAFAQFCLQEADWDLSRALNSHFASVCQEAEARLEAAARPAEAETSGPKRTISEALEEGILTTRPPDSLTLISWNIDGLDKHNLRQRTKAVCKIIKEEGADIVFLQEVIPETLAYIQEKLSDYHCIPGSQEAYFVCTLLRRGRVYFDKSKIIPFSNTTMGRHLLAVSAHCGQVRFDLLNTHLESTAEYAEERKAQLRKSLEIISARPKNQTVIYGGDLNMRDSELAAVGGLPIGLRDCWEACGRRKEAEFTWDLTRNSNLEWQGKFRPRCRFDRLYLRGQSTTAAKHFGLVGLQKVAGTQSYPSDHWGLIVKLSLDHEEAAKTVEAAESAHKRVKADGESLETA